MYVTPGRTSSNFGFFPSAGHDSPYHNRYCSFTALNNFLATSVSEQKVKTGVPPKHRYIVHFLRFPSIIMKRTIALLTLCVVVVDAFYVQQRPKTTAATTTPTFGSMAAIHRPNRNNVIKPLYETSMENDVNEPAMNPDNPALPELKGDFDWDAKFGGDPDWITENVPGKIVLNELELAQQIAALGQLEEKWRKEQLQREYEENKTVGFVQNAELLNGRFAMFFLATGLLTEYWTGVSMPGQVEEMLRIGGFIGFD
jgi:hypothetical protein